MKNRNIPWMQLSGIWAFPLGIPFAAVYAVFFSEPKEAWRPKFRIFGYTLTDWLIMICIIGCVVLLFFLANLWRFFVLRKRDITPVSLLKTSVTELSDDKRKAQQHPVPHAYLSEEPDGLTVGQYRGHLKTYYVRFPFFADPEHQYIHGLPGARKTSLILSALIWNYNFAPKDQRFTSALVVDAKPELALKSVDISRSDIIIVDPTAKDGWGFDVWHGLNQESTDDELKKRAGEIARALIPDLSGDNEHFSGNAQSILTGFLMQGFRKGESLAETITGVLEKPTNDLINEIIADPEMREEHMKIIRKVKRFGEDKGDGYESIRHTLQKNLDIFDTESVQHCFANDTRKASPEDLINGKSIFLCIPDADIKEYRTIFGLIMEICCKHLMRQSEYDIKGKPPIWILCDEAGTIYVPSLLDVVSRGRSKHIQLTVITQDEDMMERTYGRSEACSIRNNCKTKIYLACGDVRTAKDLQERTGEYRETKVSTHHEGISLGFNGQNIASEYRPIMNVEDISMLEANNQVLVFAKEGWFLTDKITYKDIPELREQSAFLEEKNHGKAPEEESSGVSWSKFL